MVSDYLVTCWKALRGRHRVFQRMGLPHRYPNVSSALWLQVSSGAMGRRNTFDVKGNWGPRLPEPAEAGLRRTPTAPQQSPYAARSNRSAFMTFVQAATKSRTNFPALSSWAYTSA